MGDLVTEMLAMEKNVCRFALVPVIALHVKSFNRIGAVGKFWARSVEIITKGDSFRRRSSLKMALMLRKVALVDTIVQMIATQKISRRQLADWYPYQTNE